MSFRSQMGSGVDCEQNFMSSIPGVFPYFFFIIGTLQGRREGGTAGAICPGPRRQGGPQILEDSLPKNLLIEFQKRF